MAKVGTWLAWLVGGYVLVCALAWAFQSQLIWFPMGTPDAPPAEVSGARVEEVWLVAADGTRLHAWHLQADGSRGTMIFCHGNAGNLSHRLNTARGFVQAGLDVLLFDYRGFGRSDGRPSEEGTYLDAEAAWKYVVEEHGVAPGRVLAYGESLGGAVAVELATRRTCGALFVESSFRSLPVLAAAAYPFLPARWLVRPQYASEDKIGALEMPTLIAHGPDDEIVPFSHGKALFERAREPRRFIETEGGHNDGGLMAMPQGPGIVRDWIAVVWAQDE